MTTHLNALPAATDKAAAPLSDRKTSNLLALCLATYREGDIDSAFDLFISGMERRLNDEENASVGVDSRTFGEIIERALSRAALSEPHTAHSECITDAFDIANLTEDEMEMPPIVGDPEDIDDEENVDNRLDALAAMSEI